MFGNQFDRYKMVFLHQQDDSKELLANDLACVGTMYSVSLKTFEKTAQKKKWHA